MISDTIVAPQAAHFVCRFREPSRPVDQGLVLILIPAMLSLLLAVHYPRLHAFLLSLVVYNASLGASIVLYRLSLFHPCSRYPGPMMCKISKLWFAWVASYGKQHLYIKSLHDKYGDVVRIGECC